MKDTVVSLGVESGDGDHTSYFNRENYMCIYTYASRTVNQVLENDKGRKGGAEWLLLLTFRGTVDGTQSLK